MPKFTYLFGAGASARKLPIVKDFSHRLELFNNNYIKKDFKDAILSNNLIPSEVQPEKIVKHLSDRIENICIKIKSHASIDTYARKLYLIEQKNELNTLKSVIDLFLLYEHRISGLDERYDAFIATILTKKSNSIAPTLPHNLNILTWNYDIQFEDSLNQFTHQGDAHIDLLCNEIDIVPSGNILNKKNLNFSLIKLNGTCAGHISSEKFSHQDGLQFSELKNLQDTKKFPFILFWRYYAVAQMFNPNKSEPSIFYSWEDNLTSNEIRSKAIESVSETEYLTIIGYSYPTFNRQMDRLILNSCPGLKEIHIQDANPKRVRQRVESLLPTHIKTTIRINEHEDTDEFFIPFEFN